MHFWKISLKSSILTKKGGGFRQRFWLYIYSRRKAKYSMYIKRRFKNISYLKNIKTNKNVSAKCMFGYIVDSRLHQMGKNYYSTRQPGVLYNRRYKKKKKTFTASFIITNLFNISSHSLTFCGNWLLSYK